MKTLVFIQAVAPYRVDYYNYLHDNAGAEFIQLGDASSDMLFSQDALLEKCSFRPHKARLRKVLGRTVPTGVCRILREFSPEAVIVPEFHPLLYIVAVLRPFFRKKFRILSQCDDSYGMLTGSDFTRMHGWARRIGMRLVDDVILVDTRSVGWYREHYGKGVWMPIIRDERRFVSIPVLETAANGIRKDYGINDVEVNILFVGRLVAVKNLYVLIDACASLACPYRLFIVGDGEMMDGYRNYAEKAGVKSEFVGGRVGDEVLAWYRAADVLVLPSTMEAFGAVTNEALLCGCPVCASDRAGSACLVEEGVNGYVFNPEDAVDLAGKIELASKLKPADASESLMNVGFSDRVEEVIEKLKKQ